MISDALIAIMFIAIPSTLIAAIVMIITKEKIYALRAIALYLLVSATVLLASDDNIKASIAMTVGGIVILLSSLLFKINSKKINISIVIGSFILTLALFLSYALYPLSDNLSFSIEYDFEGCSFNQSSGLNVYGGCNLLIKATPQIEGILPINVEYEISLCEVEGITNYFSYYDSYRDYYVIALYSEENYRKLKNSRWILCIDEEKNRGCVGCLYEEEITFR